MPVIRIETNLPKTKITAEFVSRASKLSAELTQRPEQGIELIVLSEQTISFAGSQDPAAFVFVGGIDCVGVERRTEFGKRLNEFLVAELGLKSDRFYIQFYSIQAEDVSFKGKLFSDILAGK